MSKKKRKFLDHVVIHDKKEVWFRGDYPTCMGIRPFMEQHYPGYTSHIGSDDYLEELERNND